MADFGISEILALALAAGSTTYSLYEQNKQQQGQQDAAKNAAKAQAAANLAAKKAALPQPHTQQNFPNIWAQLQSQIPGVEASSMGGLAPGAIAGTAAANIGQPGFSDLAQQIISQSLNSQPGVNG